MWICIHTYVSILVEYLNAATNRYNRVPKHTSASSFMISFNYTKFSVHCPLSLLDIRVIPFAIDILWRGDRTELVKVICRTWERERVSVNSACSPWHTSDSPFLIKDSLWDIPTIVVEYAKIYVTFCVCICSY